MCTEAHLDIILCYGPLYTPFFLSHTQKHNACQVESNGKECQLHVCNTVFSSKANWESPVKLLKLFPNANMCYQINKATKDANREIRAARLASVGRKRNETFPSKLCPMFSPLRAARTDLYVFVWRFGFESLHKEPGPSWQRGNSPCV